MPRNSNGVYTLPVAAFVSGTVIKSADMNSDLSDIATALTQSVATTGVSPMTGPLQLSTGGSVTVPSLIFTGNSSTGLYQPAPNSIGVTTNGINALTIGANQQATWAALNTFNGGFTVTSGTCELNNTVSLILDSGVIFTISAGVIMTMNATSYTISTAASNAFLAAILQNFTLVFTIDGGGSVPATGNGIGFLEVPCNCTVKRWTLTADQSGSAVIDVTKSTYAGFPPSSSIAGTDKPTLSSAQKNQSSALTGWTTTWTAGDYIGFNLSSVTTCQRLQLSILLARTSQ